MALVPQGSEIWCFVAMTVVLCFFILFLLIADSNRQRRHSDSMERESPGEADRLRSKVGSGCPQPGEDGTR